LLFWLEMVWKSSAAMVSSFLFIFRHVAAL
jgi:hypothetical protein